MTSGAGCGEGFSVWLGSARLALDRFDSLYVDGTGR